MLQLLLSKTLEPRAALQSRTGSYWKSASIDSSSLARIQEQDENKCGSRQEDGQNSRWRLNHSPPCCDYRIMAAIEASSPDAGRLYDELLVTLVQTGDRRAGERLAIRWQPRLA